MHNPNELSESCEAFRPAWVEVDLKIISQNVDIIKSKLKPDCKICAVVKADAYGHGQTEVMKLMLSKGIDTFAVATLTEASRARSIAPQARIIVLGLIRPDDFEFAIKKRLTVNLSNLDHARLLNEKAAELASRAEAFAAIDTGMGRIGFLPDDEGSLAAVKEISEMKNIDFLGLMSHFSGSNDLSAEGIAYTDMQLSLFESFRKKCVAAGISLPICSMANSYASLAIPDSRYQLVRPGAALYGSYPTTLRPGFGIMPAMSVRALIMHLKRVPAGSCIGYYRETTTDRESIIATLNIGYADGIPRTWASGLGYVLVRGQKAKIAGVVCMDQFMVDVTDVPGVSLYDTVTIIGNDGGFEITADEIGAATGSIFDTICCDMALRLPYKYIG